MNDQPMNEKQIAIAAQHYVIAALWADCPEGTNPRATKSALEQARADVEIFALKLGAQGFAELMSAHENGYGAHADCGNVEPACAAMGHDIYLTSAGHGVGFWDRSELPEALRDTCTAICRAMGNPDATFYRGWLYLG